MARQRGRAWESAGPSKEEDQEFCHLVTSGLGEAWAQEGLQVPWGGVKWPRGRRALTADHRGP